MSEKNKKIVEQVNAAFAEGNNEGFLKLCADDVEWKMIGEKTIKGKNAVREFLSSMECGGTEPPHFTVDALIAEGDSVVGYGDMTMKTETGEDDRYSYCDIYQFSNDEIVGLQSFVVKHTTKSESEQKAAA